MRLTLSDAIKRCFLQHHNLSKNFFALALVIAVARVIMFLSFPSVRLFVCMSVRPFFVNMISQERFQGI